MTSDAVGRRRPTGPTEVELKYRVRRAGAADAYLAADELRGLRPTGRIRTTQLEDRYVDTADGALARSAFAARLRVSPSKTLISVKSTARSGGDRKPHRREELEGPADHASGPRDWPSSDARSLILELCGDAPLVELVTIRQRRRKRELRDGDTVVELSLDEVDVVARRGVVERFTELEVELLRGDEARLTAIAQLLDANAGLEPSKGSKLEAALAAVKAHVRRPGRASDLDRDGGDPRPAPVGAPARETAAAATAPLLATGKTPGVSADDHVAEAGRKVLRFHLARMLAREAGTREGTDPEDLHGMRVATRRMRAAWRVFGPAFRPGRTRRYRRHLRDIARRLGAVRDLDVLMATAEAWQAALPESEQRALAPLLRAWGARRDDARRLLLRELDSGGHKRFVEDFRVFVESEGAGVRPFEPAEPHHVRDTAPSAAWAAYGQVRAYEPILRLADHETLHDLRIAAKWLRYTLEFVREPLGPDVVPLLARVVAIQDHLGLLNDAHVAAGMIGSFLAEQGRELAPVERQVTARYLASQEREMARLLRSVGPAWGAVSSVPFRRRLGRAVAAL